MVFEGLKARFGEHERLVVYSEKERMLKLILMILIPFYCVWGLFNFFFFMEFPVEYSVMTLVCGFFAWGAGIVIVLNQRQMEAAQYHCFRQLAWRMSVTQRIKADVYVDREIEYIGLVGGYQVYKPHFAFGLSFDHPHFNDGEGITFNTAFWLLPDKWEQTFFPVPQLEAWYGALPVSVKAEDVTLHNLGWAIKKGEYIPVALVVDSNRHFEATLGRVDLQEQAKQPEVAKYVSQIAALTSQNISYAVELAQEVQHNKGLLKSTENLERLVREEVQDIKKRHGDIKRIPSERWKNINWRLVLTGLVVFSIIGLIAYVLIAW